MEEKNKQEIKRFASEHRHAGNIWITDVYAILSNGERVFHKSFESISHSEAQDKMTALNDSLKKPVPKSQDFVVVTLSREDVDVLHSMIEREKRK